MCLKENSVAISSSCNLKLCDSLNM
jgi:hypothetical protein